MTRGEENNVVSIRKMTDRKTTSRQSIRICNAISSQVIKPTGEDISNKDEKKKGSPYLTHPLPPRRGKEPRGASIDQYRKMFQFNTIFNKMTKMRAKTKTGKNLLKKIPRNTVKSFLKIKLSNDIM